MHTTVANRKHDTLLGGTTNNALDHLQLGLSSITNGLAESSRPTNTTTPAKKKPKKNKAAKDESDDDWFSTPVSTTRAKKTGAKLKLKASPAVTRNIVKLKLSKPDKSSGRHKPGWRERAHRCRKFGAITTQLQVSTSLNQAGGRVDNIIYCLYYNITYIYM